MLTSVRWYVSVPSEDLVSVVEERVIFIKRDELDYVERIPR